MSALSNLEPALFVKWKPDIEISFNPIDIILKMKLRETSLQKMCHEENFVFSSYYKSGKIFDKNGHNLKISYLDYSDCFDLDNDILTFSFWGSEDYDEIEKCKEFSQPMAECMFVLDHFFDFDGKLIYPNFYENPISIIRDEIICMELNDVLSDLYNKEVEESEIVLHCLSLINGFNLAFSKTSGPLPCEVHTLFQDISRIFNYSLTEYDLRKYFNPFFNMFYGDNESIHVCVNVISSHKVGQYKKIRNHIPNTEPLKRLLDQAVSIFENPINHPDVITKVYDTNFEKTTVVFVTGTYDDYETCSLGMLHPFFSNIVNAMHKDIDLLLTKYSLDTVVCN